MGILASAHYEAMVKALQDDLNIPVFLSECFIWIREWNRYYRQQAYVALHVRSHQAIVISLKLFDLLKTVLGIGVLPTAVILDQLSQKNHLDLPEEVIETKILERTQARLQRDFNKADNIRKELLGYGIVLMDSSQGTTWRYD